jgi:AraC family transcriptional regulator
MLEPDREPRVVDLREFHVVGMARTYLVGTANDVPQLWREFWPRHEEIAEALPDLAYGVCIPAAKDVRPKRFEYVAAVEVRHPGAVPGGMVARTIPAARYIVFTHKGPVAEIPQTIESLWTRWLPRTGHTPTGTTDFELYDERFDPMNGGEVDLYVPIK